MVIEGVGPLLYNYSTVVATGVNRKAKRQANGAYFISQEKARRSPPQSPYLPGAKHERAN